ncbi:hypothetical protein IEQ34_012654 [Dendrobium chrysotoxum]|uniref:Uncharacterized protein n=1 Tax=Dendrobium chrysotoxum TaxID=161865 RepID=A0AAV7GPD4_DENCH|nr:hypothetical protein IEQ34_012654 [Dendrobium chrysotoxum]
MPSSLVSSAKSPSSSSSSVVTMLSKLTIVPNKKSICSDLKLSVSDLPMLSCHYIQKGLFFPPPPIPIHPLFSLLATSLSRALSYFPPLAGRLFTDAEGCVFISSTDAGCEFSLATAPSLNLPLLLPPSSDVPIQVKSFFPLDCTVSHDGHFLPLSSFQLTELGDGSVFLACTINHAVVDGTSFWNFFNAWAEICRSPTLTTISRPPNFIRNFFPDSSAVLRFPGGKGPAVTFPVDSPIRERIFHFRRESIQELKDKANNYHSSENAEAYGKSIHDKKHFKEVEEISSFQSLCAQLWRSVTRARKHLQPSTPTTFRMAVNCRRRVVPAVDDCYFGNAIQSIPTTAAVGEVAAGELSLIAGMLRRNVAAHGDEKIRKVVAEWETEPRCFPLGNPGGAGLTMGSSPRFPMYERNDFGWGEPVAVRSGKANKFDGKISAFPGREGGGNVDLEVCLAPETMGALLQDMEFMHYVEEEEVDAVAAI